MRFTGYLYFIANLLLISAATTGCQSASTSPTQPASIAIIETSVSVLPTYSNDADFIQIAWFYKPPAEDYYSLVSNKFDTFILTNHDEVERDQMRALGMHNPVYQYLLLAEIQDPGSCTETPNGDQVANLPGDFCRISSEHPEWFLLDQYGQRITNGSGYYYMDPAQEGFRSFWLERARETQTAYSWDGLFLDNVEAGLSKYHRKLVNPIQYPDDASLQSAVEGFLSYLDTNYFTPENRPVTANIIEAEDSQAWYRYLQYLDGAMLENFAVDWDGYLSTEEWEAQLALIAKTQALGKSMILVAQGTENDPARQEFAFATYLLLTNGNISFRYTNDEAYRESWWYGNYEIKLGKPLGALYFEKGIWMRDFEHGRVSADPLNNIGEISLQP